MHEQLTRLIAEAAEPSDRGALLDIYNTARHLERKGSVSHVAMSNILFVTLASWFGQDGELYALQDALTEFLKSRLD